MMLQEVQTYIQQQPNLISNGFVLQAILWQPNPDDVVLINEYPGMPPERTHDRVDYAIEHPSLQIKVRSKDYQRARNQIEKLYRHFGAFQNAILSGVRYISIAPLQTPYPLGKDGNQRWELVFNARVSKVPSPVPA